MNYDASYYDSVWERVIKMLPVGGSIRYDMRQYIYAEVMKHIPKGSKVFDYACGLGQIDIMLEAENDCLCNGCDFSAVAAEFVNMNIHRGQFRHTDKIWGGKYDVIIGIAFLEHTEKPREWVEEMLKYTDKLIVTIPNNFRQQGEHHLMQWKNWEEFGKILEGLNWERVDEYDNSQHHTAWRSPVIIITKEKDMHPSYREEKKATETKEVKKVVKKAKKKIKKVDVVEENAESKSDNN